MPFNTGGFIVGLMVARQNNLPQSAAVTIGAVTSAMGGLNARGIIVAMALAQRQAPVAPPPAPTNGTGSLGAGSSTAAKGLQLSPAVPTAARGRRPRRRKGSGRR